MTGIVLAAGGSTRMGTCKALLDVGGRPLIALHIDALAARFDQVRVVIGADSDRVRAVLPSHVEVVLNSAWATTAPRDSLLLALRDLAPDEVTAIAPVDTPPAPARVLDSLLAAGVPAVPSFRGADGHPVLARAGDLRGALATGTLHDALAAATRVPVDWAGTVRNFNRPAEWSAWLASERIASERAGLG